MSKTTRKEPLSKRGWLRSVAPFDADSYWRQKKQKMRWETRKAKLLKYKT